MYEQEEYKTFCPYCGEPISIVVDCSVESQTYIEDCEVCCNPINFEVTVNNEGIPNITASHENDT